MAQVTVYLDDELDRRLRAEAARSGVSVSAWLADLIRRKTATTWPPEFAALAGSCPDFPEDLPSVYGADTPRESA